MRRRIDPAMAIDEASFQATLDGIDDGRISLRTIGDAMGLHLSTIQKWVKGRRQVPMEAAWRLADLLATDVATIAPGIQHVMDRHGIFRADSDERRSIGYIRQRCRIALDGAFAERFDASASDHSTLALACGELEGNTEIVTPDMIGAWLTATRLGPDWWGYARACDILDIDVGDLGSGEVSYQPADEHAVTGRHTVGSRLNGLRERSGLSLAAVAEAAGYAGASSVQKYFQTSYDPKTLQVTTASRLADVMANRGSPPVRRAEIMALSEMSENTWEPRYASTETLDMSGLDSSDRLALMTLASSLRRSTESG